MCCVFFFPVKPPSIALSETENKSLIFRAFGEVRLNLSLHWHMVTKVKVTFWITGEEYITGSIRPPCIMPLLVIQHSNNIYVIQVTESWSSLSSPHPPPPNTHTTLTCSTFTEAIYIHLFSLTEKYKYLLFFYEGLFSLQCLC